VTGRFVIEDLFHTVHASFRSAVGEIEKLIDDRQYAMAEQQAQTLLATDTLFFYEYAYVNTKLSEIYLLNNKLFDAYQASMLATMAYLDGEHRNYGIESARMRDSFKVALISNNQAVSDNTFVSNEIQVNNTLVMNQAVNRPTQMTRPPHIRSSVRFSNWGSDLGDKPTMDVLNSMLMENALNAGIQIHARLGHFTPLYNDYERFSNEEPRTPATVQNVMDIVDLSANQSGPLKSTHRIDGTGQWLFFPYRRTFAVIEVQGALSSMDFQCEDNAVRLAFQADSEWSIPASWGECAIRFRGEEGSTFSVIEFADR